MRAEVLVHNVLSRHVEAETVAERPTYHLTKVSRIERERLFADAAGLVMNSYLADCLHLGIRKKFPSIYANIVQRSVAPVAR